ncbi:hypothetical protein BJV74DRAFT_578588 [Russula compacta]|nr:hypothetical protein BJV74DRAFT_578588 [Russula compacta]
MIVEEMERVVQFFFPTPSLPLHPQRRPPKRDNAEDLLLLALQHEKPCSSSSNSLTAYPDVTLASLIEPVIADERVQLGKDSRLQSSQSIAAEVIHPVSRTLPGKKQKLMHRISITSRAKHRVHPPRHQLRRRSVQRGSPIPACPPRSTLSNPPAQKSQ